MRVSLRLVSAVALISLAAVSTLNVGAQDAPPKPTENPEVANARMLRFPDVSATHICFVYAGDIWIVAKTGGAATRLSTAAGEEYKPKFSPDGKRIAFSGNYDGNVDIYVLPIEGGIAQRVTHHPGSDLLVDWTPDGKSLLFSSSATSPTGRYSELFTVSDKGGLPKKLPMPWGDNGSFSPDGNTIAYTPWSLDFRTWKRYRGGMSARIWKFDLKSLDAAEISTGKASYGSPMWSGDCIYYICDDNECARNNLVCYDNKTGKAQHITNFTDFDVRFASLGPADIVFEHGSRIELLDLKSHKTRAVDISVVTDGSTLRPRTVDVSKAVANSTVSPGGERAGFEARGDIFTVPAEHGVTRNITRTPGIAERYPAWSPDGKTMAYFTDRGGEYELATQPAEGGAETIHTKLGGGFKYTPQWSPDCRKLAFIDQTMRIRMHDLDSGKTHEVDKELWSYHGDLERFRVTWSADSRWMAYSRGQQNQHDAVYIFDTTEKTSRKVTSAYYSDSEPSFDPAGNYLYFLSNRNYEPIYSDVDNTWIYTNSTQIVAVPLRKDVKSPLATRNDDVKKEEKKEERKPDDPKAEKPKVKPVGIDFDDFERRIVELPVVSGRYAQLQAVEGKVLYLKRPRTGSADKNNALVSYDLDDREEQTLEESCNSFQVSGNGRQMLVENKGAWTIRGFGGGWGGGGNMGRGGGMGGGSRGGNRPMPNEEEGPKKEKKTLSLADMQLTVDPVAEWKQIFADAWRIERDYFYDPGMHGVNWPKIREQYGAMLGQCVTRWDVNYLIGEMIGEINASHTYRWGGDEESAKSLSVGMLGCDYSLENGRYRISRIYDGAPWDSEVRSPLREPGLNVEQGGYLIAVNGVEIDVSKDPWAAFQGLGGKTVALKINNKPTMDGAREVFVTTMANEGRLRYLSAVEATRARVEKASNGDIGYVYVPDTGRRGQNELVRQMRAQYTKKALIIDERWNGGGQLPDRFVEMLNRPILNYWGVRDGADWQTPGIAHNGPKAMLINGRAGSGGDAFPYYFKAAGVGKLIGTRTWGGLIGYTGVPSLIDGGTVIAPTFGIYNTKGEWIIEGYGVDPDIEVIADPGKIAKGADPELDRAIEELKKDLAANPPVVPKKPAYPDRSK
ncbi:MAG: PD40 domain-containing protein [Planctomycetes bacterium]|nr:PD40 domain-containing protein [Planctomycetota bacterium]